jgi:hypothetical protein
MNNNLVQPEAPVKLCTREYLEQVLHGANSSAAMDTELNKINAHFAQEEAQVKWMTSIGVTLLLVTIAFVFYLHSLPAGGTLALAR